MKAQLLCISFNTAINMNCINRSLYVHITCASTSVAANVVIEDEDKLIYSTVQTIKFLREHYVDKLSCVQNTKIITRKNTCINFILVSSVIHTGLNLTMLSNMNTYNMNKKIT